MLRNPMVNYAMPRSKLIVNPGEQGLPGLVAALDFGETSGDALDLTLMHNASRYRPHER